MIRTYFNGKSTRKSLNLDEKVAFDASIQAAILSRRYSNELADASADMLVICAVPLSLGIKTAGGFRTKLLPEIQQYHIKVN